MFSSASTLCNRQTGGSSRLNRCAPGNQRSQRPAPRPMRVRQLIAHEHHIAPVGPAPGAAAGRSPSFAGALVLQAADILIYGVNPQRGALRADGRLI